MNEQELTSKLINEHNYTLSQSGCLCPPTIARLTIKAALAKIQEGLAPSAETVRRAIHAKEIKAKRTGKTGRGIWLIEQASFNAWLREWQRDMSASRAIVDDAAIASLNGQYDPEVIIFPDPRLCGLILIHKRVENNQFVQAFLAYHSGLNVRVISNGDDCAQIIARSRARKILWISDQEIPSVYLKYRRPIDQWII